MRTRPDLDAAASLAYVSTGHLPTPDQVRALVMEVYERYKTDADGQKSQVYPVLAPGAK
jgi:glutaminase